MRCNTDQLKFFQMSSFQCQLHKQALFVSSNALRLFCLTTSVYSFNSVSSFSACVAVVKCDNVRDTGHCWEASSPISQQTWKCHLVKTSSPAATEFCSLLRFGEGLYLHCVQADARLNYIAHWGHKMARVKAIHMKVTSITCHCVFLQVVD